jgi:hypothetical protein
MIVVQAMDVNLFSVEPAASAIEKTIEEVKASPKSYTHTEGIGLLEKLKSPVTVVNINGSRFIFFIVVCSLLTASQGTLPSTMFSSMSDRTKHKVPEVVSLSFCSLWLLSYF